MTQRAIVLGLGALGAEVAERAHRELDERGATDALASGVVVLVQAELGAPDAIAAETLGCARTLLAHERMVHARDAPGEDGLTELVVIVVASLGEAEVRAKLSDAIARIETRLLDELGPIFERHRTLGSRNLVILPLLSMPHPRAHADGADIARAARELVERVRTTPLVDRAVPQVYLVEDVAEFSVLGSRELVESLRNFVMLLALSRSVVDELGPLIHGPAPDRPLATFACAVAELPRERIARYAENHVALETLEAMLDAKVESAKLADLDAIETLDLAMLDRPDDAATLVRELIERYVPSPTPDAPPIWHEPAEVLRARYGPDTGDPSLDDAVPPPDPPEGFALDKMRGIEDAWRLLQRRRFDDVIARERAEIERARDAVLGKVRAYVDRSLFEEPSPEAFRRTTEIVDKLRRAVGSELEEAVSARDAIRPPKAPSFAAFSSAHAELLDAARGKPDLRTLAIYGTAFVLGVATLGPTLLAALADALSASPADWYEPALRERSLVTSIVLGLATASVVLGLDLSRSVRRIGERWKAMWDALETTVEGPSGSVLHYFERRVSLARQTARVEALLAVRAALDRDAERLLVIDRAAQKARSTLLDEQQRLGAVRSAHGEDLSALLGRASGTLIESLTAASSARSLVRGLPTEARASRVRDVLGSLAGQSKAPRWREEPPFASIDQLRAATRSHARSIAEWDPFGEGPDAEATAETIAGFVRRHARSLRVALDLAGERADGAVDVIEGTAIIPNAALDRVRAALDREGALGRQAIPCVRGVEGDRAYFVVVRAGIPLADVRSLASVGEKRGAS